MTISPPASESLSRDKITLFESIVNDSPKSIPTEPQEVREFHALSKIEQMKTAELYYDNDAVKDYYEVKWKAELHNRDCFLWLWEVYKDEPKEEFGRRRALEDRMAQFRRVITGSYRPYKALMLNFAKYKFNEPGAPGGKQVEWDG